MTTIDCAEKHCDEEGTLGITLRIGENRVEVILCPKHFDQINRDWEQEVTTPTNTP